MPVADDGICHPRDEEQQATKKKKNKEEGGVSKNHTRLRLCCQHVQLDGAETGDARDHAAKDLVVVAEAVRGPQGAADRTGGKDEAILGGAEREGG